MRDSEDAIHDGEARDWAALPLDAISCILRKLDHIEILMGAGHLCRSWRSAARDEPALWHRIDMRGHPELDRQVNLYKMAQDAIRGAQGQCEAFWAEYAADDDVLHFLGDQLMMRHGYRLSANLELLVSARAPVVLLGWPWPPPPPDSGRLD